MPEYRTFRDFVANLPNGNPTNVIGADLVVGPAGGGSGGGSVTSVGISAPASFQVIGSPVTTTGVISLVYAPGYVAYTTTEQTKLAGIENGATANQTNAYLLNRANHTGTQDVSTVTGLGSLATLSQVTAPTNFTATGTPSNTTFLRGDNVWATPPGGGGGGGQVNSVVAGTGISVNSTDPVNPIVALSSGSQTSLGKADTALQPAAIGATVQGYDADLASWAGVTRATGFDVFAATPSSANLAALLTDETGTGANVFANSPTLVTPALGTPSSVTLTNATGLPISTGVSGLGTGVATFLATPSSANLRAALTDEVGTGSAYFVGGALGTPASATLTNATGLPISTGVSGLGTNVATFLATPSSANLRAALTDETGTGVAYFVGGALGTPSSATLTNATGLPLTTGVTGTLGATNGGTGLTSPGASGNVLTSNGTAWVSSAPSGSAGIVPVGSLITASSSAALDFVLTGGYKEYVIKFWDLRPATDNSNLWVRTSTNGGSSFDAGSTDYRGVYGVLGEGSSALTVLNDGAGAAQIAIAQNIGNDVGEMGASGEVRLFIPSEAASCLIRSDTTCLVTNSTQQSIFSYARRAASADVDAVRLLMSTGNISTGFAQLYGVVTA